MDLHSAPTQRPTPMDYSLAVPVGLHEDPVVWPIRPSWQPGPNDGFTPHRNRKGISAGYPADVFTVPLCSGSMDPTTVCNNAFPLSSLCRLGHLGRSNPKQLFPTVRNDIHAQHSSMGTQTVISDDDDPLLLYTDTLDLEINY